MRRLRPALALAVLLVACASDPGAAPEERDEPKAGAGGSSGAAAGQPNGGASGASSAGSGGVSGAGQAGASGSSGQSGNAGATAGKAGASGSAGTSGQGGGGVGQAGQGGKAGQGGEAGGPTGGSSGKAGSGGASGSGGAAGKCELPFTLLCDCKSARSSTARGEWTCPPGATAKACDCSSAPTIPSTVTLGACKDATGDDDQTHKVACDGDTEFPVCWVVASGTEWIGSYCANPLHGPSTVKNGGAVRDVKCCKPVKP